MFLFCIGISVIPVSMGMVVPRAFDDCLLWYTLHLPIFSAHIRFVLPIASDNMLYGGNAVLFSLKRILLGLLNSITNVNYF